MPCGHLCFCTSCADTDVFTDSGCPICWISRHMVMHLCRVLHWRVSDCLNLLLLSSVWDNTLIKEYTCLLSRIGVDWWDRRLIKNLYTKQETVVRLGDVYSKSCEIRHGTRQGCPLSPLLFNIYVEELNRMAMENCQDGISVRGKMLQSVHFADDRGMVADTKTGL